MKNRLPFEILFEDDDLIVIDKPAGLLTTHTRLRSRFERENQATAENMLNDYVRKGQAKSRKRVWLIHRLDRETSGVMAFAKSEAYATRLRDNWSSAAKKTYVARVEGRIESESGRFESELLEDPKTYKVRSVKSGGKKAITEWKVLRYGNSWTDLEVNILTGRKNQIRVHFSEAGHPIVGDVKYGARKARRLYLHSDTLAIKDKGVWSSSNSPL